MTGQWRCQPTGAPSWGGLGCTEQGSLGKTPPGPEPAQWTLRTGSKMNQPCWLELKWGGPFTREQTLAQGTK